MSSCAFASFFPASIFFSRAVLSAPLLILGACAVAPIPPLTDIALTDAMRRQPVVLLGEVHDSEVQHRSRAAALRRLLETGARPALAFEQFDRERQVDIERARAEPIPSNETRVDHLIAVAGTTGWTWSFYAPFLQLALDHDLPIVAANLSRADATRVVKQGFGAIFDAATQTAYELDRLPADYVAAHADAVARGHCGLMPTAMLPVLARAQIARDLTLALSIRPYLTRGVVLFTGNGHARNDIGVPFFLTPTERARTVTIGLLEADDDASMRSRFDVVLQSPPHPRADPCEALRDRMTHPAP